MEMRPASGAAAEARRTSTGTSRDRRCLLLLGFLAYPGAYGALP